MNAYCRKIFITSLTLLFLLTSLHCIAKTESASQTIIDPMINILFKEKAQKQLSRPIIASVILTHRSRKVLKQITGCGAEVLSYSKRYPLATIAIHNKKELKKLAQLKDIKQIHSVFLTN